MTFDPGPQEPLSVKMLEDAYKAIVEQEAAERRQMMEWGAAMRKLAEENPALYEAHMQAQIDVFGRLADPKYPIITSPKEHARYEARVKELLKEQKP